jgi:hemerythrin superfamily protein
MAGRRKSAAKSRGGRVRKTAARQKDAIALLKADHREVEKLFRRYQGLGERAIKTKGSTIQKVCTELQVHDMVERELLYPMTEQIAATLTKHALEEHEEVNKLIEEIKGTEPDDERMGSLMETLISSVKEHVQEEEKEIFPELQGAVDKQSLKETGRRIAEMKKQLTSKKRTRAA